MRLVEFQMDDDDMETVPQFLKQFEERVVNHLSLKGIPEISKVAYTRKAVQCMMKVYNEETGG